MTSSVLAREELMEVPTADHGTEVLWVEEHGGDAFRLLSVPVFVYGVSRGAVVKAYPASPGRLLYERTVAESDGATVRCYCPLGGVQAGDLYLGRIVPDAKKSGLAIGPATFFDPAILAVHVVCRNDWQELGKYLDELARAGLIRFWELADPSEEHEPAPSDEGDEPPWELIHPRPDPRGFASATREDRL